MQNALGEHSAILSTLIIKATIYLSLRYLFCLFFEWPLKTGFTVVYLKCISVKLTEMAYFKLDWPCVSVYIVLCELLHRPWLFIDFVIC